MSEADAPARRVLKRRAVLAMASTASGGIGLLAIAWLATRRLSAAELGFFFSFLSFGALMQLADFGLSYAALQTAGSLVGKGRGGELPSLARRVRRWNLAAVTVAVFAVAVTGWAIFSSRTSAASTNGVQWRGPWAAYLACVFFVQLAAPGISLREGGGKITQMWRLRLAQEWASSAACLIALAKGAGLWSLAAFALARACVAGAWLTLGDPLPSRSGAETYSLGRWMLDVWPFQWKIGLSGLSGYLIFRAFSPIILWQKGPILAGKFGLAIAIMNLLIAVSSAWPMSQAARYAAMVAQGRRQELRREFPMLLWESTAVSAIGAAVASFAIWAAQRDHLAFALHFPDAPTTGLVLSAAVAQHVVLCLAMFLRSEGREPLLVASVAGSIATAIAIFLSARFGSLQTIAMVNMVCALTGIPVAGVLLKRRHRANIQMNSVPDLREYR